MGYVGDFFLAIPSLQGMEQLCAFEIHESHLVKFYWFFLESWNNDVTK